MVTLGLNKPFLLLGQEEVYSVRGEKYWGFGGPTVAIDQESATFFGSSNLLVNGENQEQGGSVLYLDHGAVLGATSPITNFIPTRDGLYKYKVRRGDTLSGVAAQFGISLQSLRAANPGVRSLLQVDQELVVLPVSGIIYEIKPGDTLPLVASKYRVNASLIKEYNPDYQKLFETPGRLLVLPYAKPVSSSRASYSQSKSLPDLKAYYALPARGWNWGELHDYNAVDIADRCGTPIYAAAEGLVIEEFSGGSWNQGYGNYVKVEHPNNTKTLYSHTLKNLVRVGDYVSQGEEIALMGSSGNTHGPTGCHLHFEVYGAQNPFAIK